MFLEKLRAMLKKKEEARAALAEKSKKSENLEEVRSINTQIDEINNEITELRAAIDEAEKESNQEDDVSQRTKAVTAEGDTEDPEARSKASYVPGLGFKKVDGADLRIKETEETEKRYKEMGEDLKEKRAVTVGASGLILPQHQSTEIGGTFNQVSSLIDGVTHKPLQGGESYKKPYVKSYGTGDYTAEETAAATAEPTFGYAEMTKAKVTAYAEDTEETEKLPAVAYAQEVENGIRIAIRKKITREILIGDGTTNHLMGIFNTPVILSSSDVAIDEIDTDTLNTIVFSYGGDEDVEDAAVLILNKKDLMAFSQLKTTDGKSYHKILTNGNRGTIDGVPFIINSACKAISDSATVTDAYSMAYGPLSNYELAIFSDVEVKKSTDYKFKEGMIAHKGVTFMGGNVTAHNGFLRVKKGSAA